MQNLDFFFFRKYILSSKAGSIVRTIARISMVAIAMSSLFFILVLSVMMALNQNVRDRILSVEPHLTFTKNEKEPRSWKDLRLSLESEYPWLKDRSYFVDTQDVIVRSLEGHFQGALAVGMDQQGLEFLMQEVDHLNSKMKVRTESYVKQLPQEREIYLGIDLARSLNVFEGDLVTIIPPESLLLPLGESPRFEKVRIKKILSTNVSKMDSESIYFVRGKTLTNLGATMSRNLSLQSWNSDPDQVDAWKKKIQNKWPGLRVETWKDKNSALFLALRLEKMTIGIFLGLAALIAVFSMVSALSLLVSQKRSEIGLMQALGMSGRRIQQLFLKLGVFISGFGILIGAGVGSALAMLLEKYPLHLLPDYYVDSEIPALLNTGFVLVYIVLGLGISVAAAWVPAKSVLDVTPVKALRQKV